MCWLRPPALWRQDRPEVVRGRPGRELYYRRRQLVLTNAALMLANRPDPIDETVHYAQILG